MPRNTNPGNVRVGSGRDAREHLLLKVENDPFPALTVAHLPPDTSNPLDALYGVPQPSQEGGGGLWAHVRDGHDAGDITLTGVDPLTSNNMADALVELAGDLPPEPSTIGMWRVQDTLNCIPDWGRLKLADSSLVARGLLTTQNNPAAIFPYYWVPPSPAISDSGIVNEFSPNPGADPQTDPLWNSGIPEVDSDPLALQLVGAGPGDVYAGAFTRPTGIPTFPVVRTDRILRPVVITDPRTGLRVSAVTVSGVVYPADRGVLALIHLPAGMSSWTDFTAQTLIQRCPAALVLGQGLWGASTNSVCDGQPGGIFGEGVSPFDFPGRATGQYNLTEIVTGQTDHEGIDLPQPWYDLDRDGVKGAKRFANSSVPGPGQVRLGTDPDASPLIDLTSYTYGIPVLGADHRYYSPDVGSASWDFGYAGVYPITYPVESNFFQYRLPCLDDYSQATGLFYTPAGVSWATREKNRYFDAALPNSQAVQVTPLAQAGNYPNFPESDWARQIARFRHSICLFPGDFEVGTFWLIHFKTEGDFEHFMLDPVDAHATYDIYGAENLGQVEVVAHEVVNTETDDTVAPPAGPAPNYGYKGKWYHAMRADGAFDFAVAPPFSPSVQECVWSVLPDPGFMYVSGVAYFTVIDPVIGNCQFQFDSLQMTVPLFWGFTYRTNEPPLFWAGGPGMSAPAQLASMNPAFLNLAAFAWGAGLAPDGSDLPYTMPVGATDGDIYLHTQRVEFPYTHLGGYDETNGPRVTDPLTLSIADPILFNGDPLNPAFTTDAQVRLFLRTPAGHASVDQSALPFDPAAGHGNICTLVPASGASGKLLLHTSRYNAATEEGLFGNYLTGGPGWVPDALFNTEKDSYERFLDETYRWDALFPNVSDLGKKAALLGPGLPWAGGFFPVSVRIGAAASNPWHDNSWVHNVRHLAPLPSHELQVAGLPDRNPPLSAAGLYPFPSVGLLLYPQKGYHAGYRPSNVDDGIIQPDYSGLPADDALRQYVRAFDAGFGDKHVLANGSPFVTIRLDGVRLSHFVYLAPGPGHLFDRGFSVELKVPGLTTWMDIGRSDGSGPSKQDIAHDGAGCMIVGPETFEAVDPVTGFWYSQVKVHLGPVACLTQALTGQVTCSVLVRVSMKGGATPFEGGLPFNLEVTSTNGTATPGTLASDLRGLIGIRIVDTYPALPGHEIIGPS